MDWGTLVATVSGGTLAVSGTVLADFLRNRREDGRGTGARRREVYIEFISAAGVCHSGLREIAQSDEADADRRTAARTALSEAGLYEARERLFIDATATVAGAGQAMFEHLRSLQRAVADGASLTSTAFHDAYHPYIGAVWRYRVAVREELEGRSLSPQAFGWEGWDGSDRCSVCRRTPAPAT
ncbi:CchlQ [Streptomyces ovatisporus]|uniref:CchlQ n=1 Tax=Streptomyces ovatisporus TaxID=1128682 RepID=A0ABV9A8H2_9ACTN